MFEAGDRVRVKDNYPNEPEGGDGMGRRGQTGSVVGEGMPSPDAYGVDTTVYYVRLDNRDAGMFYDEELEAESV